MILQLKILLLNYLHGYGVDYRYYAIFVSNDGYARNYFFAFANTPLYYSFSSSYLLTEPNSILSSKFYRYEIEYANYPSSFDFSGYNVGDTFFSHYNGGIGSDSSLSGSMTTIVYSNHTIFTDSSETEEVFHPAPQEKVELMKAIQPEGIPQQILQILAIVLPIFLGIFGVLLVLYLIRSKILLPL